MTTNTRTDRIRALNDDLRQHLIGGGAVISPGIAALGWAALDRIVKTIAVYDDFCHDNDPYGEIGGRRENYLFQDRLLRQGPRRSLA
jgi:hypothetical protein